MITDPALAQKVHYFFEWSALMTGLLIYSVRRRKAGAPGLLAPGSFPPLLGGLLGAAAGNKLAFWFDSSIPWSEVESVWSLILGGQSVVGGLLGGWLGVEAGKRVAGITIRTGDDYVLPVLCGLIVGRTGCFLAGLHDGTCGLPTSVRWGVDFGDGIPRHPTQLYEALLAFLAAITWPRWHRWLTRMPGSAFRVMMVGYLLWRILVDFLKPISHAYLLGLSGIQWICIVGLVVIMMGLTRDLRRKAL